MLACALLLLQMAPAAHAQAETPPAAAVHSPHGVLNIACEKCHSPSAWRPIRSKPEFDHSRTGYPLRGLHTKLACQQCHVNPVFANVGRNCQKNGAQCDLCHRVNGWQVSIHSINEHQDRFPLIGAHAVVDCYSCHKLGAVGEFNRQGLSTACNSCHLTVYQRTTAPNHQALGYSMECLECHSMDSWMIAAMPHARFRK